MSKVSEFHLEWNP